MPAIAETAALLRQQLGIPDDTPIHRTIEMAVEELGLTAEVAEFNLVRKAEACARAVGSHGAAVEMPVVQAAVVMEDVAPVIGTVQATNEFESIEGPSGSYGAAVEMPVVQVVGTVQGTNDFESIEGPSHLKNLGQGLPVGIQHAHLVPNHWLTASSEWPDAGPHLSRFRQQRPNSSCWSPSHPGEAAKQSWIQIDLQRTQVVTAVATQGNSATTYGNQWTTSYNISYSTNGHHWVQYPGTLQGNRDRDSEVVNIFEPAFEARYVRLSPQSWYDVGGQRFWNVPCIRWELYTRDGGAQQSSPPPPPVQSMDRGHGHRGYAQPPNNAAPFHPEGDNYFWRYYKSTDEGCPCEHEACGKSLCWTPCLHGEITKWTTGVDKTLEWVLCWPFCGLCMIENDRNLVERKIHEFHRERGDPRAQREPARAGNGVVCVGLFFGIPAAYIMHAQNYWVMKEFQRVQAEFL